MKPVEEQLHIIASGTAEILPLDDLKKKLAEGRPLTIKLGVDPTAPDLHLGHAVPLRKMRQFQDLGHKVVLLIGDFTAPIGDPSGRSTTRPPLTREEVEANAKTYTDQAFKVLDPDKTELRYNSEWLAPLSMADILRLTAKFTVARMLERDDFEGRYKAEQSIGLHEFLYPVMVAYDSVALKADVEMGGTDQKFNLLAGRELMSATGMEPQVCLTVPILEGTDGVQKMSKTYGNYVGLTDEANDMFGKVMSIPDELPGQEPAVGGSMIARYFRLATSLPVEEVDAIEKGLADGTLDPYEQKRRLAREIVRLYHPAGGVPVHMAPETRETSHTTDATVADPAEAAEAEFDRVFKERDVPSEIPEFDYDDGKAADEPIFLPKLMVDAGLVSSSGEARRLIQQGGAKIDGEAVAADTLELDATAVSGKVLQAGKRKFVRAIVERSR